MVAVDLWWEIEAACNLSCAFCYNPWRHGMHPPPASKSGSILIENLERLAERISCRSLTISGGEPLLHPDLDMVVAKARQLGIPTILSTNGLLLTRARVEALGERGVSTIQVSLHSHLRETHNELAGGIECWEQAVNALASVRSLGIRALPTFVATSLNVAHFKHVVEICELLDLPGAIFNRVVRPDFGFARESRCAPATDAQILDALDEADEVARGRAIILGVPLSILGVTSQRWNSVQDSSCPIMKGQSKWIIGPDLTLKRCSHGVDSIGTLDGAGFERMLGEVSLPRRTGTLPFRPCSRLNKSNATFPLSLLRGPG